MKGWGRIGWALFVDWIQKTSCLTDLCTAINLEVNHWEGEVFHSSYRDDRCRVWWAWRFLEADDERDEDSKIHEGILSILFLLWSIFTRSFHHCLYHSVIPQLFHFFLFNTVSIDFSVVQLEGEPLASVCSALLNMFSFKIMLNLHPFVFSSTLKHFFDSQKK